MPKSLQDPLESPPDAHPFERRYHAYNLKFKPQETPEGDYQAFVIVTMDLGYIHTCGSVTPSVPPFANQMEAALAGWAAGRDWVDRMMLSEQEAAVIDASGGLSGLGTAPCDEVHTLERREHRS